MGDGMSAGVLFIGVLGICLLKITLKIAAVFFATIGAAALLVGCITLNPPTIGVASILLATAAVAYIAATALDF